ncbi:MAG: lysine 2,3-aminomutase [bacterium]
MKKKEMISFSYEKLLNTKQIEKLSPEQLFSLKVVSSVLPFRVNNYIIDELIDWNDIDNDPMFTLYFMNKKMLKENQFNLVADIYNKNLSDIEKKDIISNIRLQLNPHPAKQLSSNVPVYKGKKVEGIQHKYSETCLIFPSAGQTCHAYCTFCFRWAQFVGDTSLKFSTAQSNSHLKYIQSQKNITDILLTGGDPMVMKADKLKHFIDPFLTPEFEHIKTIRIGTKSLVNFPYKYLDNEDSDNILKLFEEIVNSGKHLAIMVHINHWREMQTDAFIQAVKRIKNTGAEIRTQSPILHSINDDASVWSRMWKEQVHLGLIPYYMFVERETGAEHYFNVPLYKAFNIYRDAFAVVSGLARTVRGPSMSSIPGKVVIDGIIEIENKKYFVLNFIQARNPEWIKRPFLAHYDKRATWLFQLKPASKDGKFFFEDELESMYGSNEFLLEGGTKNAEDFDLE